MLQLPDLEIKNRLELDNPWWNSARSTAVRFSDLPRRSYFEPFLSLACDTKLKRAPILMGPRRVGKTVLIYHTIQALLDAGHSGQQILYLSIETPVYTGLSLEQLLNKFMEIHQHPQHAELYCFFDEIQYLKNWEIHLKSLVDAYPAIKFVASGSAAAALKLKSQESGAGRFTDFLLPSLSFAEYLRFIDKETELISVGNNFDECQAKDIEKLNQEFINYLNYGGYPEAVFSERIQQDSAQFIKSDIIDKVLLRDLPSLYGIQDIQELNRLFTTIAYNTGNEITLEELSKTSGVAKNTLKKYLNYLEAAFLIRRVKRIDENAKRFKRATSFKVYLTNPSMRAALFGAIKSESEAMGALTETAIYAQWLHSSSVQNLHYARWKKGEVDIVCMEGNTPLWAVEIKWSDLPVRDDRKIAGIIEFSRINKIKDSVLGVTTKTVQATKMIGSTNIEFTPSAIYAYQLGKNILNTQVKL